MIWLCKSWIILLNAPFETWETFQLFMLGSIAEQCIRSDQVEFSDRCDSIGCGIFSRNQRKFPYFLKRKKRAYFLFFLSFLWNACHYLCHYNYTSLLITNNSWVVLAVNSTRILSNKCSSKIYNLASFEICLHSSTRYTKIFLGNVSKSKYFQFNELETP